MSGRERIVVKVGTSTLTYGTGKTNFRRMEGLVRVMADLQNAGYQMVLVTSGAIGVGVGKLGLDKRPEDTPGKQAAATVGQLELMYMYDKFFGECGQKVGQLLITRGDMEDPARHRNLMSAFERLFDWGVIPIINENDAVAVEEIVYGDNDALSAHVAVLVGAKKLIILTDIDGFYDKNPALHPDAKRFEVVEAITPELCALARGAGSAMGTGGMETKLKAAKLATGEGIDTHIISGYAPEAIYRVLEGAQMGTWFKAVK